MWALLLFLILVATIGFHLWYHDFMTSCEVCGPANANGEITEAYENPLLKNTREYTSCMCNQCEAGYARNSQFAPKDDTTFLGMMASYRSSNPYADANNGRTTVPGLTERPKCMNCHGLQNPNFHHF